MAVKPFPGQSPKIKNITALQFSSCGKYLITGLSNGNMMIWHHAKNMELTNLRGYKSNIAAMLISSDKRFVVSADDKHCIRYWDFATGEWIFSLTLQQSELEFSDSVTCMALSPCNNYLTTAHRDGKMRIWDLSKRLCIREIKELEEDEYLCSLTISPCGTFFVSTGTDAKLRIWDFKTAKCLSTLTGVQQDLFYKIFFCHAQSTISKDSSLIAWQVTDIDPAPAWSENEINKENCLALITGLGIKLRWPRVGKISLRQKTYDVIKFSTQDIYKIGEYILQGEDIEAGKPCFAIYAEIELEKQDSTPNEAYKLKSVRAANTAVGYEFLTALCSYLVETEGFVIYFNGSCCLDTKALWQHLFPEKAVSVQSFDSSQIICQNLREEQYRYALKVYGVTEQAVTHVFRSNAEYSSLTFTSDNRYLLAGGEKQLDVWNLETKMLMQSVEGDFSKIHIDEDDHTLLACSMDGQLQKRSLATLQLLESKDVLREITYNANGFAEP